MPNAPRSADVARRLVDAYVTSLRQHLPTYCIRQLDKLPGAQEHQLNRLRQSYPGTPTELLYFLQRVNGTCWESLAAPPGASSSSSSTAVSSAVTPEGTAAPSSNSTAAASAVSGAAAASPARASTVTAAARVAPTSSTAATEAGKPPKTAAAPTSKLGGKATAAAATIASEAAAFLKSTLGKKGTARSRRLPHYVALPILGSTYTSCPYYLKSVEQMLQAEQQFPPPSANLPDEGEGWAPAASAPSPQPAAAENTSASVLKDDMTAETAPAGVQLNQHTISSVFAGYKVVYGVPPSLKEKPMAAAAATATIAATASGLAAAEAGKAAAAPIDITAVDRAASSKGNSEEEKVVYIDPRIDTNASFYHWLAFADSVQPHVRGQTPAIPDADPAKVAAAAAAPSASNSKQSGTAAATSKAGAASPSAVISPSLSTAAAASPVKVFAPSRLYIDFKPAALQGGVSGQVIQFVHGPPSSFTVVADDFGSYLKYIMSEEFEFTEELEDDEDDEYDE
jgi:hypothetical protein